MTLPSDVIAALICVNILYDVCTMIKFPNDVFIKT